MAQFNALFYLTYSYDVLYIPTMKKGDTITYEWTLETHVLPVTEEIRDIDDVEHDELPRLVERWFEHMADGGSADICLARGHHEDDGNLLERQHAYFIWGGEMLTPEFDGGARIPQAFLKEFEEIRKKRLTNA